MLKNMSWKSSLEIACGSGRDSNYLANSGFRTYALDYEPNLLKTINTIDNNKVYFLCSDAFNLPFHDKALDISFHNGFYVLFNDNDALTNLLLEQVRVTKKGVIIIVHNKKNKNLVQTFIKASINDPLYNIRFFNPNELLSIINQSNINYKNITLYKFGGYLDLFFRKKIKGIPNILYQLIKKFSFHTYQLQSWEQTERIVCLLEL